MPCNIRIFLSVFQTNCSPDYQRLSIHHCRPPLCAGYSQHHHILHLFAAHPRPLIGCYYRVRSWSCTTQNRSTHRLLIHDLFDFHPFHVCHLCLPKCNNCFFLHPQAISYVLRITAQGSSCRSYCNTLSFLSLHRCLVLCEDGRPMGWRAWAMVRFSATALSSLCCAYCDRTAVPSRSSPTCMMRSSSIE